MQTVQTGLGTSGLPTGLKISGDFLEKVRQKKAEQLKQVAPRIRESYGEWLTDLEVMQIYKAEQENQVCARCTGLPCRKTSNPKFRQVIQPNEAAQILYVANNPCKYIRVVWEQNRLKELFQTAEIPAQYSGLTFEDYKVDAKNQTAVKVAHKLLNELDKGVFYYGSYGAGKTMLAAIIAQEHLRRGRSVLFSKLPDLLRSIRATYSGESKVRDVDILQKIYSVPILILDDVKAVEQTKFAGETLFDIIDARYNARLQTIMTSNNTLEEVANAFDHPSKSEVTCDGSRIYDRCKANCLPIKLEGLSRR